MSRRLKNPYFRNPAGFVREVTGVSHQTDAEKWNALADALVVAKHGSDTQLRELTRQLSTGALFHFEARRLLHSSGLIDLLPDGSWRASPASVVELSDSKFRCVGSWPQSSLQSAERSGGMVLRYERDVGPDQLVVDASVVRHIEEKLGSEIPRVTAEQLLGSLPSLREELENLPKEKVPHLDGVQTYDPKSDAWINCSNAETPGAYRSMGYGRRYFVRLPGDVESDHWRPTDASMAKHGATCLQGHTPLMYWTENEGLVVPLGADLPGLLARAVLLSTGMPPQQMDSEPLTSYAGVPQEVAALVARNLVEDPLQELLAK